MAKKIIPSVQTAGALRQLKKLAATATKDIYARLAAIGLKLITRQKNPPSGFSTSTVRRLESSETS
jgi:hypothetical protein